MRYLLDTTLLIDHANGYPPAVSLLQQLFEQGAELFSCDVIACEALSGGSDDHLETVRRLLGPLEYISTSPNAAAAAGAARLRRHRAGGKLGLGDALIAAIALDLGAVVVTRNRPDFARQGAPLLSY